MKTCSVDGCDREFIARGLCTAHYARLRIHGTTEMSAYSVYVAQKVCKVDGCSAKKTANGFCQKHNRRMKRYGQVELPEKIKPTKSELLERGRERSQRYRDANKDRINARNRARMAENPELKAMKKAWANKPENRDRRNAWSRKYYSENREEILARDKIKRATPESKERLRIYYLKNKEAVCLRSKKWVKENQEKARKTHKNWYAKNREYAIKRSVEWHKENPEKTRAIGRKYMLNNKEKYSIKSKASAANLDDSYIKNLFSGKLGVKNPPQELIELKRVQLKIYRELNRGNAK